MAARTKATLFVIACSLLGASSAVYSSAAADEDRPKPDSPSQQMAAQNPLQAKRDTLSELQRIQQSNLQALRKINEQLDRQLSSTRELRLEKDGKSDYVSAIGDLPRNLSQLKTLQVEYALRRDFVDRLIFQVDSRWNGVDFRKFLEDKLLDMAATDLKDESGQPSTAAFATYLSMAVREIAEGDENMAQFIEGYMAFSTLSSPKAPSRYLAERSYLSGPRSYRARGVAPDKVGELTEKKIARLERREKSSDLSGVIKGSLKLKFPRS